MAALSSVLYPLIIIFKIRTQCAKYMVELPANTIEVIELIMSTLNMLTSSVEELSRETLVSYMLTSSVEELSRETLVSYMLTSSVRNCPGKHW